MKHPSCRLLHDYWNERRGARAAPERADIEPGPIRRALGDSFILAFDPVAGHPFRLAGTRLCGLFGRELRNEAFDRLWEIPDRPTLRDLLAVIADEAVGIVAGATGRTPEGHTVDVEVLLLPLRHRGNTHARQIGVLAPLAVPYWLGSSSVAGLALKGYRHLGPAPSAVRPLLARDGVRQRRGLVVYDGGRS